MFFDFGGTLTSDSARQVVTAEGIAAVKAANDAGHLVVIVSNQKAVALGRLTPDDLEQSRESADAAIRVAGAHVDAWCFCQHGPDDGCGCREPSPGLLLAAGSDLDIDLQASAIVGDRDDRDVAAGRRVGALTALLERRWVAQSGQSLIEKLPATTSMSRSSNTAGSAPTPTR